MAFSSLIISRIIFLLYFNLYLFKREKNISPIYTFLLFLFFSGLGYVVGQGLSAAFGSWHWALRGTPILGAVAIFGIVFFLKDPPRGESEGHEQLKATSYTQDLKSLMANKSFILTTLGFTCVTFCTGALGWWGNLFLVDAVKSMPDVESPMDPGR